MGQSSLGDYSADDEDARPASEEAKAVAGNTSTNTHLDKADVLYEETEETVDIAVMQVDYTIEGSGDDEYPVIHVFGRTTDGELVHARVREFKPYFYTPVESVTEGRLEEYDRITAWEETDENGQPFQSIRGTELLKVYGQTPRDVGQIRDEFDHYEADILFPNRFLIDKDITSGIRIPRREIEGANDADRTTVRVHHEEVSPVEVDVTPRVNTFDIEVEDRHGFPEDGEEPIICIASHDSYDDQYILWLVDAQKGVTPPSELPEYEPIQTDTRRASDEVVELDYDIRIYESEAEMLAQFLDYLDETDPDVLTGWNFDDFDAPYLVDRLDVLDSSSKQDLDSNRLSRVNEVWDSGWGGPDIKGRVVFDLLYAYQRTQFTELESYRLEAVGQRELGIGKERYTGDIGDMWEENPERLLEYNLRDVELCVELDREQDIVAFWNEVRQFVGCKLEDATTPGDAVDMYVLHKLHDKFALPSKGQQESEEYEGGAVFDPITGVRENVSVLDLKSLYPMCMVTINASPETKVDPDSYGDETYRAPNGTHFQQEPDGAIRGMVDELLTEREQKKELRNQHDPKSAEYEQYDRQQAAVKVIMNCFTPDTEVLTPDGVRLITDLEIGDEVYSLDPGTMNLQVKEVTDTHAYPDYRGELVDIQTSKIDFRVTPNHRMLVRQNDTNGITQDSWDFIEAGDLNESSHYELPHDWDFEHGSRIETVDLTEYIDAEYEVWVRPSVHGHTFTTELGWTPPRVQKNDIGQVGYVFTAAEFEQHREYIESVCERSYIHAEPNRKWIPRVYDGDEFIEFLAWYITEGNVYTTTEKQFGNNYRGCSTTVKIAQSADSTDKEGTTATQSLDVLPDGGDNHHSRIGKLLDSMGFDCYTDDCSFSFTSELLGNFLKESCGDGSFEKRIPECIFQASREQKQLFLETLIDGDGDRQPNSWRFSTASQTLRDDVIRLCAQLGKTVTYNHDSGSWRVYCTEGGKNSFRMHRSGSRSTADEGVYCVTVEDNHTLMAGRNGTFQHVGQSLYGVLGWTRFRLYDREMGAAVTATGREVIEFTEEVTNELDKEVIYGDSVTGDRPVVVRDAEGNVRITPIEDLFERAQTDGVTTLQKSGAGTVRTDAAPKEYATLEGWEALSLSSDGTAEWQPIERVIRHETTKDVLTLQHKYGESTTTRDHSYVVEDGDEYRTAAPEEVEQPLRIPDLPPVEEKRTLDIYEVLEGYERTYEDGRGGRSGETVTKTKRIYADEQHVWFGHEHHGDIESLPKVKRYVDLESEDGHALVRLLAAYVTEGSASTAETADSKYGASIAEERFGWLDGLQNDYHRLFSNVTTSIIESDTQSQRTLNYETGGGTAAAVYEDTTHKLQMMNELTAVFFRQLAGQTSRGKRVPSFVFHLPEETQDLFLNVLVEGDGSRKFPRYTDSYAERNFDFETTSRELAAGVAMLLIQRGKKYSLKYRPEKDSYTIRTVDSYRRGRDPQYIETDHDGYVYDLSVSENENFVDGVGGIVLHNTDSVMVSVGNDVSKDEAIDRSLEIEDRINDSYDEFALEELNATEHRFQIEFEKLYRRFFQAGKKKRYAGHIVWKEGQDVDDIDITGFEYQRSDIAAITKEVQKNVIEMIVTGDDFEDIKTYVTEVIEEFKEGNADPERIGIPGGIGKRLDNYDTDTAQVRGAKYANLLLGTNFQRGSKPKRLYLKRVHSDFFERIEAEQGLDPSTDPLYGEFKRNPDVICIEYADQLPEEFEIDWEKMLEKTLQGPIERILEALDITWQEVKSGQEQKGLGEYM